MAFGERPAGTGLQVRLETRGRRFVREFQRHKHLPRPVLQGVAGRARVVPLDTLIDVRRTADVVPRRVRVAAKDVNESRPDTTHVTDTRTNRSVE
jgi:hypothetical protein